MVEAVEVDLTSRLVDAVAPTTDDPLAALIAGADAWLDASGEPEVRRIVLLDGPAVLGWERWREVGMRHGLGLVTALLTELMEAGAIPAQPVEAMAHVLIGAMDEAALYVALAADPARLEPRPARCCVVSSPRSRRRCEVGRRRRTGSAPMTGPSPSSASSARHTSGLISTR